MCVKLEVYTYYYLETCKMHAIVCYLLVIDILIIAEAAQTLAPWCGHAC